MALNMPGLNDILAGLANPGATTQLGLDLMSGGTIGGYRRNAAEIVNAQASAQAYEARARELDRRAQSEAALTQILPGLQGKSPEEVFQVLAPIVGPQEAFQWAQGVQSLAPVEAPLPTPLSPAGKLQQDYDNGLITKEQLEAGSKTGQGDFKQFELSAAGYGARMNDAVGTLDQIEGGDEDYYSGAGSFLDSMGAETLANFARSDTQQTYQNAADDWIRAKLRKESGAAIGDGEMEKEYRTYFPQRGDSAKVIEQKKKMRQRATDAMKKESGGAYQSLYGSGAPSAPATGTDGWSIKRLD